MNANKKNPASDIAKTLGAGLVGAAAGAGIVLLSDKKNRQKISDAIETAKKKGNDALASAEKAVKQTAGEVREKIKEEQKSQKK